MIKAWIYITIGIIFLVLSIISFFLVRKKHSKSEFVSKKTLGYYFLETIPIILFVCAIMVGIVGIFGN